MVYNLLDFYCNIDGIAVCDTDERHDVHDALNRERAVVDDAHVDHVPPAVFLVFVVSYRLPTRL